MGISAKKARDKKPEVNSTRKWSSAEKQIGPTIKCSYDYLEILENFSTNTSSLNDSGPGRRLCGDWSSKLKLLRYVSKGSKLRLRFSSDYSHHFGGFKARVSMENVMQCSDDRLQMFNNSCYLFVSYPEVTWSTAQQICNGIKAQLTSVLSPEEEKFISTNIRKSPEYRTSALYWFGGRSETNGKFYWVDGSPMGYSGWLSGNVPEESNALNNPVCLGVQWMSAPSPVLPSGLYWKSFKCEAVGGYVCKRPNQVLGAGINFNKTVNGTEGHLTTPNYPGYYYNNLDFFVRIIGPERTRLVMHFEKLDVEQQPECLYDYVELRSVGKQVGEGVKWCGNYDTDMQRFDFVSEGNEAELKFHSDYSIAGSGFLLHWRAVDVSGCPMQTFTAREGLLTSPNYPNLLLPRLDCSVTILAPTGKRVWLEFQDFDVGHIVLPHNADIHESNYEEEEILQIELGNKSPAFKPFEMYALLTEGAFISDSEGLQITLKTGDRPVGKGFKAIYKTISVTEEERIINLNNSTVGSLLHLNYPDQPSSNVNYVQHFVAPLGHIISLELYQVKLSEKNCPGSNGIIEIYDNYADSNGTQWYLCYDKENENNLIPLSPIAISSYLNTLHVRQKNGNTGIPLNGTLRTKYDPSYKAKLLELREANCELEPCVFGKCELTSFSYKCHCKTGYIGINCDQKQRPCEGNPCESRGVCIEKGTSFHCRCHAWWEGPRCERKMMRIPYKPLSERMLEEPFWLGLITVTVVMGVIGLVWCAKRHFPEKIEKLLAEDSDANRSSLPSLRTSLREQLAAAGGSAVTVTPSPGPGVPRSLFGRLGIRKPSILSLTSPRASGYSPATARTFSLDDLLKPPRRTPSPRKKRNNSTPTKKNAAEKKQILQQLVTPSGNKQLSRKVSLGELIQLSERKVKDGEQKHLTGADQVKETKLSIDTPSIALTDPKLEKKVTFARLLNRVSAEMSSGSDMELGIMQANRLGCAFARPSSTPPSPAADARSPNSTSSNQGSDTFSSSDLAIPSTFSCSISDLMSTRKHAKLPNGRQKPASADSILAMFRNFSSSSAGVNLPSSLKVSPSTTPTASSPQDDIVGDDESSTSSIHTPISFSSGPPESPILHRQSTGTIEVPVLDMLSAHKSSSSGSNLLHPPTILLEIPSTINKCLSPIRELPTPLPSPMPSPALTPIMHRSTASSSINDMSVDTSDDRISFELPNISISDEEDMHCTSDIAVDPHAEDGLILEEAAVMQQANQNPQFKIKARPSPLGSAGNVLPPPSPDGPRPRPPPLVIPTLTIQTPSPTHQKTPPHLLGSPPPHRSECQQESNFSFSPGKQTRKMLKEFDKPTSLDLPSDPPMITITCNMSEAESDIESISPAPKNSEHLATSSAGMCYLSPFTMGSRGDRTASESNLSSSGYSSMASPGPSRCGSSNPLCPSEMEDPGPPGPGSTNLHPALGRRPSPLLKSTPSTTECSKVENSNNQQEHSRGRSDSETLSDDPLVESNDEGIGTDHLDEKIEDGELKSAKELEVFITSECDSTKTLVDLSSITSLIPRVAKCTSLEANMDHLMPPPSTTCKSTLQLPSIVVQNDPSTCDKHLSPMSSRSESPLSDKTLGLDRFSPQFYGRNKDALPFTDSDGLYDFPSSDKVNITSTTQQHRKSTGRRREKKSTRTAKGSSPTKIVAPNIPLYHLDVPGKESLHKVNTPRKPSPKRRARTQQLFSSSSSSDSITSGRDVRYSSSTPSPDTIRWSSSTDWINGKEHRSLEASGEETGDETEKVVHPKSLEELPKPHPKISRLRVISNQIRFLRRLELSLKRKDRVTSPSESIESGEDSPRATSPLLQPSKEPRPEIRKSSSIGKLHANFNQASVKAKRGRYKRGGELLIPQDENNWKRVVITGNGYSD
ncbi:hypothetical protein ILUMI_02404 [Ignelater luminosus]|uniref:Uncharacterized protein n=1 Tax=Ignelater luminosus TaxID=2038154 RepID=A0A8K0DGJ2_IGNLU|nr:hypothetical protein ILUMI_02404 [Ignelater luminosus]